MSNNLPKCPQCGTPLPENAPAGLCPNCLMALNLKTETVFTGDSPAAQPPLPPDQIAPHFPQLEILECLGRGGMGVVYKARQKTLNRHVALKLLAPERVGDAKFAERFTREAQALAALNHPNIVTIHDFGQAGGFYFLLMEFVDGVNLRQLLRTRKFTPEEALAIVPPLCDALQFAHERGIVHRDIKPENLLLDKTGRVKVADFGIAKMLGADNGGKCGESVASENATQNAVGTPGYSAPEQKSDPQRVDSRADIYSLGVVFYEMLTGELPGKKIEAPSRKVQIDVRLDEVVLRALEKTPELRWQTAADLRTQVETITQTSHSEIPPRGAVTPAYLSGMRWRIFIWGLALAAAGVSMNFAFGIFGISAFVVSAMLVLIFGNSLVVIACRLILIEGIIMATAAIWFAFNTESLKLSWMIPIVAGCLVGIGYCMSRWGKLNALNSEVQNPPPAMAAWLSLMDAGNYAQSWEAGSRSFRWAVTKGDWMEALEKVRRPLGKIISRKLISTKYSALGFRCEAKFDSSFDGLKSTAETVVFTRQWNGEWKPAGYLIGHLARQSQSLRRLKKFFFFLVPAAVLFTLIVRAYFLQPFFVAGGGVDPEIPVGSRILVWKFHPHIAPGDIIAHWHGYQVWASRVVSADDASVTINRNGQPEETIPNATILGRVVSVYWRAASSVILQPSTNTEASVDSNDTKMSAKGISLGALMAYAYGPPTPYVRRSTNRVILPDGMADKKFDFSLRHAGHPQETLQAEIKKQLGLVAHREMREADVLVLTVSNPSLIKQAVTGGGNSSDSRPERGRFEFANMPIGILGDFVEHVLGEAVMDDTGLFQKFSGSLKWTPQSDPIAERREIQNALFNQFGLDLVPSHQPVEMLVVEKVR